MTLEVFAAGIKAVLYAAALTGAGSALARVSLLSALSKEDAQARRLAQLAGLVLTAAAVTSAVLFVIRLGNYWDWVTLTAIFNSPLGLALALNGIAGLWLATGPGRASSAIASMLIVIAFAASGHAAALNAPIATLMAIHVGAAAWWVGSLWILLRASKSIKGVPFANLVARFSSQAVLAIAGLVLAGVIAAAWLLQFKFDIALDYVRVLILKVGLALALLALAAFNKFALMPVLATRITAQPALRKSIFGELALAASVLVAPAYLTTFTSPHDAPAAPAQNVVISGPIDIVNPWAAPTPSGVDVGAGYLTLVNNQSDEDYLIEARSSRAEQVSFHEMSESAGIVRMRRIERVPLAAGGSVDLKTGGYHLMFEGIEPPFVEGESIPVTLTFERRGEIEVQFPVRWDAGHSH